MELPDKYPARIPALDGLRGVAILMVIGWHYAGFLQSWFPGWQGVDLFFVLSGYLITGRLRETKGRPGFISRFYRNRVLRIVPLYYMVIAVYLGAVYGFVRQIHQPLMAIYLSHWKSFFLFTANWTFIFRGLPKDLSLVPLWSVAVEAQFYLVWPVLILLTTAKRRLQLLPALILLVLVARSLAWSHDAQPYYILNYNSLCMLDSFCAGALIYEIRAAGIRLPCRWVRITVLILMAAEIAGMLGARSVFPGAFFSLGGYTLSALLFAGVLYLAVQSGGGWIPRFLRLSPLRFCGKISYGLYLVHVPVLLHIGPRLSFLWPRSWSLKNAWLPWPSVCLCLLISFLISLVSYRYFESWFLRRKASAAPAGAAARPAKTTTFGT